MKIADFILSGLLALIFGWAIYDALSFKWQAGILPLLAAGVGLFLILLLVVTTARQSGMKSLRQLYSRQEVYAVIGFLSAIVSVIFLGIFWGGLLLVFCHTLIATGRNVRKAILACMPVLFMPLLERVLQVQFFQGTLKLPPPW